MADKVIKVQKDLGAGKGGLKAPKSNIIDGPANYPYTPHADKSNKK